MQRIIAGALLASLPLTAQAFLGLPSLLDDSRIEVFREGWPPYFRATREDFGLRGPLKCAAIREDRPDGAEEELCFEDDGRVTQINTRDSYFTRRSDFYYKDKRLTRMLTEYETGEVSNVAFEYDKRGYLGHAVTISFVDREKAARFRAEKFPDAPEPKGDRAPVVTRRELSFEYDANGYIREVRCVSEEKDSDCMADEQSFSIAKDGRPKTATAFHVPDIMAPLNLDPNAPQRRMPIARVDSRSTYDDRRHITRHESFRNGEPFGSAVVGTNEYGDVISTVHTDPVDSTSSIYRYTYDSRNNWVQRDGESGARPNPTRLVRKLTYWGK